MLTLSGTAQFSYESPMWNLLEVDDPEVPRVFEGQVAFDRPFSTPPVVQVGLAGFDIANSDHARLYVRPHFITTTGFDLRIETRFNTRIWLVDVNWLAIGTVS